MNKKDKAQADAIIEELRRIRWLDKYHNFHKVVPGVDHSPDEVKDIVNNLVEDCCTELIRHYSGKKKPTVATVRSIIIKYMDLISYTDVNIENKDFGYELCWYIAEKIGITIRKYTETKVYGYWRVENNRLREVTKRGVRNKKSTK
ncbi:MAG: hypothetical protein H6550_12750 [Chitinophagales bacterium]|nr:hypothetical protein [Chitinophagales bacterium]